ncbi:MAG TPA: DUF983 domain-containing protein [Bacteroidia bacterium]|jgi:uncharacterized protein (DUF983 family)
MKFRESKIYSVLSNKCPHCHKGNFFETNNPYDLKHFAKMNSKCPVCNEDFKREPGYYFGATYVSYALTVGLGIALFLLLCVIFNVNVISYLVLFSLLLLALMPLIFRVSRLIWINLFVKYEKS